MSIAGDESCQRKFRQQQQTKSGRPRLRERTAVERALAHIAGRKGSPLVIAAFAKIYSTCAARQRFRTWKPAST
jgi:hypothetical protein